jgi:transcriptional regulatory protein RtcR
MAKAKTSRRSPETADGTSGVRSKPLVVIGLLGTQLDGGTRPDRWEKWRPTVSLFQHEDFLVSRLELIFDPKFQSLSDTVAADVKQVSPESDVRTHPVSFEDPWDLAEVYGKLLDFARAFPFNPEAEDYLIHITTGTHVAQICLFLLTESRYLPGRLIQSSPPERRRPDAPGEFQIIDLDLSKYDDLASRFAIAQQEGTSFLKSGIETRNAHFNRLIDQIERVAIASSEPLLLMGPTGAGKSQLARRIFELKKQRHQLAGNFVEVNCATLRGDAAMSALFGHVKGSFTGATSDRAGLLRAADGGLLFLDEIGELGLDEQAMLLRALEEKRFLPVGSDREVRSDFQLIGGTNRDLWRAVHTGSFREDLLARINLWTFELPALRDRTEDIEPNVRYELDQFAKRRGASVTFNKEARDRFLRFATSSDAHWSGNFRDLNAAITRMATLAQGGRITSELVAEEVTRLTRAWKSPTHATEHSREDVLRSVFTTEQLAAIDLFDQLQLAEVITICRRCRTLSEAGRKLFHASRESKKMTNDADRLRKYLARFGLDWQRIQSDRVV